MKAFCISTLVVLCAAVAWCDEPASAGGSQPTVSHTVVLWVEISSSGTARFDGATHDDPASLAEKVVERVATVRRSVKPGGSRPIFQVILAAHKEARVGRVMLIQQALSKMPDCDTVSLQLSTQDFVQADGTALEGLRGLWHPVFSMRGELYQLLDRDESFTFDDDQLTLTNRDGTTKFDVAVAPGSPMSIDVRTKDGRTTRGILARHGDISVICWDQSLSSQRPQEFDATASPDHVLMVLVRDKAR